MLEDSPQEEEWKRALWKKSSFPDNFVPGSFLSSLSKNPNFTPYTYWGLVVSSCAVTQHIATIFTFLTVFVRLNEGLLDPRLLVWISVGVFLTGYATWELLECSSNHNTASMTNRAKTVKSSILVFLALMSLSPVLRTLTAATSSDSIWALSASLFILNALLADYTGFRPEAQHRERLTSVLSMNAAISSGVVLASRLPSDVCVFALTLFSVQTFALFPLLRRRLQSGPTGVHIIVTIALCGSCVSFTAPVSSLAAYLVCGNFVFVTFVAPGVLVWAQRYKNEIRGTWDPAVPKVYTAGSSL